MSSSVVVKTLPLLAVRKNLHCFYERFVHPALPEHFILTAGALSNKLWLKPSYAMNIREHEAAVNRLSSQSAS